MDRKSAGGGEEELRNDSFPPDEIFHMKVVSASSAAPSLSLTSHIRSPTPSMVSMLSEQRAPLSTQLLLAFAALVCVEGFAPAAAPSLLSRSKVAARPQVRRRTMPYTTLSDACRSAPRRTAAIPAETCGHRTPERSPSLCPLGSPECQSQRMSTTMAGAPADDGYWRH